MTGFPPIEELIPHRGIVCYLDRLIRFDGEALEAEGRLDSTRVPTDSLDTVPIWAGIEYVGQGIAAFHGLTQAEGRGFPKKGYIVSIRDLWCKKESLPGIGRFTVRVTKEAIGAGYFLFTGALDISGETVLTGTFGVFIEAS